MAKRFQKTQKSRARPSLKKDGAQLQELVVVTLAENIEQARDYETLLKANDIPVVIKEQTEEPVKTGGIAVMVPEDHLDEAHVVIESQDAYEDFYDLALEDEDTGELENDLFEDEL